MKKNNFRFYASVLLLIFGVFFKPAARADSDFVLKCSLAEMSKSGKAQDLFINVCSKVLNQKAVLHFSPDGDDFSFSLPSFRAELVGTDLTMSLSADSGADQQSKTEIAPEETKFFSILSFRLACTLTATVNFQDGVDTCN